MNYEVIEDRLELLRSKKEEYEEIKADLEKRLMETNDPVNYEKIKSKIYKANKKIEETHQLILINISWLVVFKPCQTETIN
jgi:hypothetical protein